MSENRTEHHATTVCLDGSEVKRQRELHGLTQLYISKVVGVTTDTISRWENNRYPTIRRENALNLAEALEVPLEQILQKPVDEVSIDSVRAPRKPLILVVAAIVLLLIVGLAVWQGTPHNEPVKTRVTAQRVLPEFAAPQTSIPVEVKLDRQNGTGGYILREYLPRGWKLAEAYPAPSSLDSGQNIARWIVKAGDATSKVVYMIKVGPATSEQETADFRGEIVTGSGSSQSSSPVTGGSLVKVAQVHWADSNGDGRIDDIEMLDTSYVVDEMSGIEINWEELERLWDADGYRWDETDRKFVPYHSDPNPTSDPEPQGSAHN